MALEKVTEQRAGRQKKKKNKRKVGKLDVPTGFQVTTIQAGRTSNRGIQVS